MRHVTVHASLEHPSEPWGGIGTAVGLLLRGASAAGRESLLLHPNEQHDDGSFRQVRVCVPGVTGSGDVYASDRRGILGQRVAIAMAKAVEVLAAHGSVFLVVHNEELIDLLERFRDDGRVKVAYYSHGLALQEHPRDAELLRLQTRVLHSGALTLVASEAQRVLLESTAGIASIVIPLPLQLLAESGSEIAGAMPASQRPTAARSLMAAGRWVPQKGFDLLIKAVLQLSAPVRCDIWAGHGDETYERRCRALAATAPPGEIRIHGWTNRASLAAAMRRSRLIAMPSRFEPLGLVAAEAVSLGARVVGSDVGGLSELLRATGQLTVPYKSEAQFVADFATACSLELRRTSDDLPPSTALGWYSSERTESAIASICE